MELAPGTVVGQYRVERPLGQGGMAVVFLVRHDILGSQHALKLLTTTQRSIRERLLREGRVQASVRHPNLLPVTDVVIIEGAPGLVMEYVSGPTLEGLIHHGRIGLGQALLLFRGVLDGVHAAHKAGVIHRDLKPANVLIEVHDDRVVPRVADFGLVKALDGDGALSTRSGASMGTPAYMAPEQIRDASRADARADIFSLGAILYELTTGARAFPGEDVIDIFSRITNEGWADPRFFAPDLPERVVDAIARSLRADPAGRFQTCAEFAAALEGIGRTPDDDVAAGFAPLPVAARAAAPRPHVNRRDTWSPEGTRPPAADATRTTGGEGLPATASTAGSRGFAPVPAPGPRAAETHTGDTFLQPRRPRVTLLALGGVAVLGLAAAGAWFTLPNTPPPSPSPPPAASPLPRRPDPAPVEAPAAPDPLDPTPPPPADPVPQPVSTSAPVSAPEPPEEIPAAPPVAAPTARPTAQLRVEGDATRVVLVAADGSAFGPGAVPAGSYTVYATWPDRGSVEAATITLAEGDDVLLKCSSGMTVCRPVPP